MVAVFGERGKHARSALGMGSLPRNIAVEIRVLANQDNTFVFPGMAQVGNDNSQVRTGNGDVFQQDGIGIFQRPRSNKGSSLVNVDRGR